jgi:hypothetical protein
LARFSMALGHVTDRLVAAPFPESVHLQHRRLSALMEGISRCGRTNEGMTARSRANEGATDAWRQRLSEGVTSAWQRGPTNNGATDA